MTIERPDVRDCPGVRIALRAALADHVGPADLADRHLDGVYHDPEGWLVATGGHRLFAARADAVGLELGEAGRSYHPGSLVDGLLWARPEPAYPPWRSVVTCRPQVRNVMRLRMAQVPSISPRPRTRISLLRTGLAIGPNGNCLDSFNGAFLEPYRHFDELFIAFAERGGPLLLAGSEKAVLEPLGAEWFGLFMPLKEDDDGNEPPVVTLVRSNEPIVPPPPV